MIFSSLFFITFKLIELPILDVKNDSQKYYLSSIQ